MIKIRILFLGYSGFITKCTHSELSFDFVYSKFGHSGARAKLESLRANFCLVFSYG